MRLLSILGLLLVRLSWGITMGWGLVTVTSDGKQWCWWVSGWVDCWLSRAECMRVLGRETGREVRFGFVVVMES